MFYSSVVQLVHDGWKIIKYTVGHATSYVLYCTFGYKGVLVRALNLHRDQKSLARTGERWKISYHTGFYVKRVLLNIPLVYVCVDRPTLSS